MYHPVQANRFFAFDTKYKDVDWNDFRAVVDAFRRQIEYWYVLPGLELKKEGHFGFAVAALASLLIDCLSQYEDGVESSTRTNFKGFLRRHWPDLDTSYPVPINASFNNNNFQVTDGADAIYFGLRCGILHEAHVKLYTGLVSQGNIADYHASGLATYTNGGDCPVVTIDPSRLFDAVHSRFDAYMSELIDTNAAYDDSRQRFRTKFEASYGVPISTNV